MAAEVLLWIAVALYGGACALYTGYLLGLPAGATRAARLTLGAGFVLHMAEIGARGVGGMHPVSSVGDSVGFTAWILVGAFLLAQIRRRLDAVGAFVAPVAMVLLLGAQLSHPAGGSTAGLGALGRLHISLSLVGTAIFALATGLAIFYLAQERQLKQRRLGAIVRKGIALETLDTLAHRCVQVGFPIFTLAMILGAIWAPRIGATMRPEYPISAVTWAAFAALLIARTTSGWRGRRAALLTLVGFSAAVVVLGIYLVRQLGAG
jgi:ABC-type uncharacterized transport system permease subunit